MKLKQKPFWISVPIYTCLNAFVFYFKDINVDIWSRGALHGLISISLLLVFGVILAVGCFMVGFVGAYIISCLPWPRRLEKYRETEKWWLVGALSLNLIVIIFWLWGIRLY